MEPDQFDDLNSGFVQELFAEYLASPEAVDPQWRALFE
ncbi:MAG: 2-oxoglutarate dehydrogenase E1 subunit family protein, partial [Gaiellaceae bacterium]